MKILAVEDQENWRNVLKVWFGPDRYELKTTHNLNEAKNLINQTDFDVVILNMNLSGDPDILDEYGLELLQFINDNHPFLPRIVITGNPQGEILSQYITWGVDGLLIKTKFRKNDLIQAIDNAIEKHKIDIRTPQITDEGSSVDINGGVNESVVVNGDWNVISIVKNK